jgi:spermidine/putrescine-binding protein
MKHNEMIELLRSGKLTRRQMTKVLASVGVGLAASPLMSRRAAAEEVNLTLLEWNGYEYESFHPEYNAKYGGQPEVTFFAAEQDAFQKMRAGFQCDLVHPCTGQINQFKDAGLIKPLETDRIPRWGDVIPYLLTVKGVQSDGETWFAPWDWGYSTVAYNPDVIEVENATFDIYVDPKYKGKTALDSGIGVNVAIAGVIGGWAEPLNPTEAEIETAPALFTATSPTSTAAPRAG